MIGKNKKNDNSLNDCPFPTLLKSREALKLLFFETNSRYLKMHRFLLNFQFKEQERAFCLRNNEFKLVISLIEKH
jgi:hypothetical protein